MNKTELIEKIQKSEAELAKIRTLQTQCRKKATTAQGSLSTLKKQLSDALASYALGETDREGLEILKAEIAKAEAVIYETPLIIEGLDTRSNKVQAGLVSLIRGLNLIKAEEAFENSKAEIKALAEKGVAFRSAEGSFRCTASDLGRTVEANEFLRKMNIIRGSKPLIGAA